jgi:ADP-L-glycero-D-manno-heptose 6-epimerase
MKKIIITGTKGFIGGNLLRELSDRFRVYEINEDIFDNKDWRYLLKETLHSIFPDAIFHVGACSDTLETDVNFMMLRNYEFTKIVSEFSFENDIKMIYSSSAANYGVNNQHPSNLYGWSKYISEQFVLQNGGVALRYFNVYGPGEEHKGRMSSVAFQMLNKFKNGEEIKLFPGSPKRDFVYVKDVIDANIYAYENHDNLAYHFYDVGYGTARSFEDVMDILGIPYSYHNEDMIPEGYQFFTESNRDRWLMRWEPKYNLELGLTDYLSNLPTFKIK